MCYAKNKEQLPEFYGEVDESLYKKTEAKGPRKGEKYRDDIALYQSSLDPLRGCKNQRYYIAAPDESLLLPPGNIFPKEKNDGEKIPPKTEKDKVWRWTVESYLQKKHLLVFKKTKTSPLLDKNGKQAKWNIYTKSYLKDRKESGTKPRNYLNQFINRKGADYIKTLGIEFNYSKPVELIEYLINIVKTEKNDIILDFFAGSSTSAEAVLRVNAKDNGHRKFILCEQMDYIENVTIERLRQVLKKLSDKDNLFKKNNSDFVYCELMKYNEAYIEKIQVAKTSKQLVKLWQEIAEKSFLNWYVNPEIPENAVNDFIEIGKTENGLEKQKKLLAELLNKNQLYVHLAEIEDISYGVSKEDKKLNKLFYGSKYDV